MSRSLIPTSQLWSGLGINFGNNIAYNNPLTTATVNAGVSDVMRFGKARVFIPPYNEVQYARDNCVLMIDALKAAGMKVVWGQTANPNQLTAANWAAYRTQVLTRAAIAQSHNVDEFTVGNEDEYRIDGTTLTAAQFRTNIRSLATDVKVVFSGAVSYTVSQNHALDWVADANLGGLDKLALNVYGDNDIEFEQRYFIFILSSVYRAYPTQMYISEFNIIGDWSKITVDDETQISYLRTRIDYIRNLGVPEAYFFIYQLTNQDFAMKKNDGNYRAMWESTSLARRTQFGIPNVSFGSTRPTIDRSTISRTVI